MSSYIGRLKTFFPLLTAPGAAVVSRLEHQYQVAFPSEPLEQKPEDSGERFFAEHWDSLQQVPLDSLTGIPIEWKVAAFLANPRWSGSDQLLASVREILDATMIEDEIEEVRRLYLQNVFLDKDLSIADVPVQVAQQPKWGWVLNPAWSSSMMIDEKLELLKMKYDLFFQLGWLSDPTPNNPVVRFQMRYLTQPRITLLELLEMDMAIPQGSEIFLRLREVNPFLISYFYNCYLQGRTELLAQFRARDI